MWHSLADSGPFGTYSIDNPPPKVVQAYRFTIFCPDLVDPTKAPTYKIIKEPGNQDTCILQFKIGPPYEDLAFRIVNKEWEYSHKKGFKSTFDRGVLQLHFNFKWALSKVCMFVSIRLTRFFLPGVPSTASNEWTVIRCTVVFSRALSCRPALLQYITILVDIDQTRFIGLS